MNSLNVSIERIKSQEWFCIRSQVSPHKGFRFTGHREP